MDSNPNENQNGVRLEKLIQTKKYERYVKNADLYSLPATSVPGCGFLLGLLLKREGITRASELYDLYAKQKKAFPKYLSCKFGSWNMVYANTIIKAFEDWEKIHVVKPEKKAKEENQKGPPRKVGPGSKKWDAFLHRTDLAKTSIMCVPGVASTLGCEMKKRGYTTAKQLMDQYKGDKKAQCNGDDEKFHKWILCCFGYWNTQYSKAVLEALKAYSTGTGPEPIVQVEPKEEPAEDNDNEDNEENDNEENENEENDKEENDNEENENQGETFGDMVTRVAESTADKVAESLKGSEANDV